MGSRPFAPPGTVSGQAATILTPGAGPPPVESAPSSETTVGSANVGEREDDRLAAARGLLAAWHARDDAALAALGLPDGFWLWFDDGNTELRRFTSDLYDEGDPEFALVAETLRMADSEVFALSGSDEVLLVMGRHEGALRILHILVMQSEAG